MTICFTRAGRGAVEWGAEWLSRWDGPASVAFSSGAITAWSPYLLVEQSVAEQREVMAIGSDEFEQSSSDFCVETRFEVLEGFLAARLASMNGSVVLDDHIGVELPTDQGFDFSTVEWVGGRDNRHVIVGRPRLRDVGASITRWSSAAGMAVSIFHKPVPESSGQFGCEWAAAHIAEIIVPCFDDESWILLRRSGELSSI